MAQTDDNKDNLGYDNLSDIIEDTKFELSEYVKKKLRLFRLDVYDKSAVIGSFIAYSLVLLLMAYFMGFLFLLTLGYLLGEIIGSTAAGFGILVFVCLIGFLIFLKKGKSFRRCISNLIVSLIKKVESDEE